MDVVIVGGHGQVARRLTRLLTARGDRVRGIIRRPDQGPDLEADGAEPVVLDVEVARPQDLREAITGADAVVFAAGAGPGSGAARKETVDYGGAVKALGASRDAGVGRYLVVSAMRTDDPPDGDDVFSVYLRAKARADTAVMDSDRDWTILRPGGLTDEAGTGQVTLGRHVDRGSIPRDDVAAVLVACLDEPRTAGHVLEVVGGDIPITDAVTAVVTG